MMQRRQTTMSYHVGYLPVDRLVSESVKKAAEQAWNDYIEGKVILTKRRIQDGVFEYLAIPRHEPTGKQLDYLETALKLANYEAVAPYAHYSGGNNKGLNYERSGFFERALAA